MPVARKPVVKPVVKPAPAIAKPAKLQPAAPKAPTAKLQTIRILNPTPVLRGSRAARWPLVLASKTKQQLADKLKAEGHKQSASGTLSWLVEAGLVELV